MYHIIYLGLLQLFNLKNTNQARSETDEWLSRPQYIFDWLLNERQTACSGFDIKQNNLPLRRATDYMYKSRHVQALGVKYFIPLMVAKVRKYYINSGHCWRSLCRQITKCKL